MGGIIGLKGRGRGREEGKIKGFLEIKPGKANRGYFASAVSIMHRNNPPQAGLARRVHGGTVSGKNGSLEKQIIRGNPEAGTSMGIGGENPGLRAGPPASAGGKNEKVWPGGGK